MSYDVVVWSGEAPRILTTDARWTLDLHNPYAWL
jgi:hypothetical protein